jgi:hypothetical protein
MDLIFSKFAAFYGHVWRSQFKDEGFLTFAKKEWIDGLSQFNDDVVAQAVLNCRNRCEMPPTLPQLIGFCMQIKKRTEFYEMKNDAVPANQAVVTYFLGQCKAILTKQ